MEMAAAMSMNAPATCTPAPLTPAASTAMERTAASVKPVSQELEGTAQT